MNFFKIADEAKRNGDYATANKCFAHLFADGRNKIGYEYADFEGIPHLLVTEDYIDEFQYHGLVFVENENDYLCIPAPLVTETVVRKAIFHTVMPRREHNRSVGEFRTHPQAEKIPEPPAWVLRSSRKTRRDGGGSTALFPCPPRRRC